MNAKTEGWSRLDSMIAEDGEEGVLARVMTRIAIGENPQDIALSMGMPWLVLRKWLEDKPERMEEWALADRCFADGLAYEALMEVRDCGLEKVPLARLRSEHYDKKAGKLNRVKWGEQKQGFVAEGMTMDQALGGFASMLLEKMRVVETVPSEPADMTVPMQAEVPSENLAAQKNSVINRMYPVVIDTCNAEEV